MRIIIFLFIALILTGAYKSVEIDEAKNVYRNWLTNPGAENGLLDVKTNDTFKVSVSTTVFAEGKASFEWSDPTTATYIHFLTKTNPYFEGEKCLASGLIKTPQNTAYGTFEVSIMEENGGLVTILKDVKYYGIGVKKDWDEWEPFEIPFRCPDTSVGKYGIRFKNMWGGFASTDKVYFDNLYVGLDYRTENEKVNYIESKGFEKGIGHWKEYTNSSAIPTNGTSPTHSFGATIGAAAQIDPTLDKTLTSDLINCFFTPANPCTEILSGNRDLVFEKSAADAQGQGISHDFQVGIADQNKLLGIWFDVDATDANYADDDLQVFVYDIANQQIITPSSPTDGHKIKKGKYRHRVAFAPYDTSAERYRLIIHVASTNASGYSVRFDNFEVGPGAIMTGFDGIWKEYDQNDVVVTSSSGTAVNINAKFVPYKTTDGNWRMKFNIKYDHTATGSSWNTTIGGVTFAPGFQGVGTTERSTGQQFDAFTAGTSNIAAVLHAGTTSIEQPLFYGDLALASKPTWADFDPIATIYPSTEDLALGGWTAYSPTKTNFTLGNGTEKFYWRRVGSNMEIRGKFVLGSTSSVGTTPQFDLPSGYNFDTNQMPDYAQVGTVLSLGPSSFNYVGGIYTLSTDTNTFYPVEGDGTANAFSATVPFTWASGHWMQMQLSVPIAEWADLGQVPPIGVELASDTQYGLVKKNTFEVNPVTANTNSTGNVTDMNFSGLETGAVYRLSLFFSMDKDSSDTSAGITATHNSTTILSVNASGTSLATANDSRSGSVVFTANASTVTFSEASVSGTTYFRGDGTTGKTHAILEKLVNY